MHGEAKLLLKFLDGSDNRYIIPVYQRNYDWQPKQCEQLSISQKIIRDRYIGKVTSGVSPAEGVAENGEAGWSEGKAFPFFIMLHFVAYCVF